MLRTALKPRWIAALLLALAAATVFVLLSQWQFSRSTEAEPAPPAQTEQVKPLVEVAPPGRELITPELDHRVSLTGRYLPGSRIFVTDRLDEGTRGYWVVEALEVTGAPRVPGWATSTTIPVARGWVADPADAGPTPAGTVSVVGRLLPSEAPAAGSTGPADQVDALSVAQLVNRWNRPSWAGFVTADAETVAGAEAGAHAAGSPLRPIATSAQPTDTPVNWLNIFYAIEWVVFAGFAFYLWWRLVADDHQRALEDAEDAGDDEAFDDEQDAVGDDDGDRGTGVDGRAPGDDAVRVASSLSRHNEARHGGR